MVDFSDPRTLALLGGGSALLQAAGASPRPINLAEGLGSAFPAAMQGMMAGRQMQHQDLIMRQQQDAAMRKLQQEQILRDTLAKQATGKTDLRALGDSLIATGIPEFIKQGLDFHRAAPKAKSSVKVMNEKGQAVFQPFMDTGEFGPVGDLPAAEKLMQINRGSQIDLANPYTGQAQTSLAVGMNPGQAAQLAQSARHHADNLGVQQQRLALDQRGNAKPQFVNGSWVYPPTANNPQGMVVPTDMSTAPKGSQAEKTVMSKRIENTLGNDTEDLIKKATGSFLGAGRDLAASVVGLTTDPAEANATLKLRAATLAGNMPRFEGPQSDADRQYYLEMAGDLANPTKTDKQKLAALRELRRINGLADDNGAIRGNVAPAANSRRSTISSGGFSATRND